MDQSIDIHFANFHRISRNKGIILLCCEVHADRKMHLLPQRFVFKESKANLPGNGILDELR